MINVLSIDRSVQKIRFYFSVLKSVFRVEKKSFKTNTCLSLRSVSLVVITETHYVITIQFELTIMNTNCHMICQIVVYNN